MIRKATEKDLPHISQIYEDLHTLEEQGIASIGWIRGVYPTLSTAKNALHRGDLFVQEDNGIVGAAIINQLQVDSYKEAHWNYDVPDQEVMVLHTLVISPKPPEKDMAEILYNSMKHTPLNTIAAIFGWIPMPSISGQEPCIKNWAIRRSGLSPPYLTALKTCSWCFLKNV